LGLRISHARIRRPTITRTSPSVTIGATLQFEITAKERLHSVIGSPEEVAAQSLTYAAVFMHIATSAEQIGDADSARTAIRKSYALLVEAQMQDQEAADIATAYQKIAGGEG
jgi:hypothetical protein